MVIRPFAIFFGITGVSHFLLNRVAPIDGPGRATSRSYLSWLGDLPTLDAAATDAIGPTLQLIAGGLLVGGLLALVFGALLRVSRLEAVVSALSVPVLAVSGPGLALFLTYWLVVRFRVGTIAGDPSLLDNPGGALRALLLPSLTIGLMLAPGLATVASGQGPMREHFGMAASASTLASRSEARPMWRFGLPAGQLVLGLIAAELTFARRGLFSTLVVSTFQRDVKPALDVMAVIALGGIVIALLVDLVGLRIDRRATPTEAGLRLFGHSKATPSRLALLVSTGLLTLVILGAIVGLALDSPAPADFTDRLAGPFSDGHLLGSDALDRDLLSQAVRALFPALVAALVPGLIAVAAGLGLLGLQSVLGATGGAILGALVDLVWWPVPITALLAALAFGDNEQGLRHPLVLLLVAVALTPTALRMLGRERAELRAGGPLRIAGIGLFLAASALLTNVTIGYAGLDRSPDSVTFGTQLAQGRQDLVVSTWPVAVPAAAIALTLLALYGLGAALVHLGWHRYSQTGVTTVGGNDPDGGGLTIGRGIVPSSVPVRSGSSSITFPETLPPPTPIPPPPTPAPRPPTPNPDPSVT